jgi:hypothetical protein
VKQKAPAFQFYPGDWRRDIALRSCSLEARGLWVELMCLMHDGDPYGHLAVNGKPLTESAAASAVGVPLSRFRKLLGEIETAGVASRGEDGALFSRRMVRDEYIRRVRAEAGKKGGNPALLDRRDDNHQVNQTPNQTDKQNLTPAVAVAVASAEQPRRRQRDRCESDMPPEYLDAMQGAFRAARNPDALAAELCMIADGARGVAYPWPVIGRALHEMAVAGAEMRSNTLAAFCRKAAEPAREPRVVVSSDPVERIRQQVEELDRKKAERMRRHA